MKKYIFFLIPLLFVNAVYSQVLYSDDFDNYTLGNLGTDPTGIIPGQGGWLTKTDYTAPNNSYFTVTTEPNKGKVLTLSAPVSPSSGNYFSYISKPGIDSFIDQRTNGNNVIKFEIDYYTGPQYYMSGWNGSVPGSQISLMSETGKLFMYYHTLLSQAETITVRYSTNGVSTNGGVLGNDPWDDLLPVDTLITFIVYMDYTNKKIYFETPYLGSVVSGDFLSQSTSTNLIEDFKPVEIIFDIDANTNSNVQYIINRYDNIKITALKKVPQSVIDLGTHDFLAKKFNIYPNPANNIVNITNNENKLVNKIEVYDTTGKLINTQNY